MVQLFQRIVASTHFNRLILILILVSGALVGMETYPQFSEETRIGRYILVAQNVILFVFIIEIALKIAACGSKPWQYFMNPWNLFDFAIVFISLPLFDAQFAMVFRMARLLRALRLLTILPDMQVLVSALLRAIPSLGAVGILLLLHFYVYAVLGTFIFSHNDPIRFGRLQNSMLTLFQVLTLEGWNDVFATAYLGSDRTYDDEWRDLAGDQRRSQAQPGAASAFFISFIVIGTMIVLNLFTGVIIGSMEEARASPPPGASDSKDPLMEETEKKGFMTLREELELISHHLRSVSDDVVALKEQSSKLRMDGGAASNPPTAPAGPLGEALGTGKHLS